MIYADEAIHKKSPEALRYWMSFSPASEIYLAVKLDSEKNNGSAFDFGLLMDAVETLSKHVDDADWSYSYLTPVILHTNAYGAVLERIYQLCEAKIEDFPAQTKIFGDMLHNERINYNTLAGIMSLIEQAITLKNAGFQNHVFSTRRQIELLSWLIWNNPIFIQGKAKELGIDSSLPTDWLLEILNPDLKAPLHSNLLRGNSIAFYDIETSSVLSEEAIDEVLELNQKVTI